MIYVGTCSWSEQTLVASGDFYPVGITTPQKRLEFYAQHFSTVEVDSSYYAIPAPRVASLWAERTPENFVFHVKVYGALTGHAIQPKTLPKYIRDSLPPDVSNSPSFTVRDKALMRDIIACFKDFLDPLKQAGKLGVLLFQYPPWLQYSTKNMELIVRTAGHFEDFSLAVEFRHGSWLTTSHRATTISFLRDNALTYVTADEPQYSSLATIPFVPAVTSDVAYIRLHGRNRQTWLKRGIATSLRYDYLYSNQQLHDFVPVVDNLAAQTKKSFIMFNNCHGSKGIRNATTMKRILTENFQTI